MDKKDKKSYHEQHNEDPPEIEDIVGRHTTMTAQYQEQHRPLFNTAWNLCRPAWP